jgi:hypothetical protein
MRRYGLCRCADTSATAGGFFSDAEAAAANTAWTIPVKYPHEMRAMRNSALNPAHITTLYAFFCLKKNGYLVYFISSVRLNVK